MSTASLYCTRNVGVRRGTKANASRRTCARSKFSLNAVCDISSTDLHARMSGQKGRMAAALQLAPVGVDGADNLYECGTVYVTGPAKTLLVRPMVRVKRDEVARAKH
jgi:hypothetical protein